MIQVKIDEFGIYVEGHGKSEICACVSLLMQELDDCITSNKISNLIDGTSYVYKRRKHRSYKEKILYTFVEKCLLDLTITYPEEIVVNIANRE